MAVDGEGWSVPQCLSNLFCGVRSVRPFSRVWRPRAVRLPALLPRLVEQRLDCPVTRGRLVGRQVLSRPPDMHSTAFAPLSETRLAAALAAQSSVNAVPRPASSRRGTLPARGGRFQLNGDFARAANDVHLQGVVGSSIRPASARPDAGLPRGGGVRLSSWRAPPQRPASATKVPSPSPPR